MHWRYRNAIYLSALRIRMRSAARHGRLAHGMQRMAASTGGRCYKKKSRQLNLLLILGYPRWFSETCFFFPQHTR